MNKNESSSQFLAQRLEATRKYLSCERLLDEISTEGATYHTHDAIDAIELSNSHYRGQHDFVAAEFNCMEDLIAAHSQESPKDFSYTAIWDTYSNPYRNMLECKIARQYEAEDCLLVNSGMAAIYVAIMSQITLNSYRNIIIPKRSYFETSSLIKNIVGRFPSINLVEVEPTSASLSEALHAHGPSLILLESVLNYLEPVPMPVMQNLDLAGSTVVVDNTLLGPCFPLRSLERITKDCSLIFVESGSKYISTRVSSGLIWGHQSVVQIARDYALQTGVNLQQAACRGISLANIDLLKERIVSSSRSRSLLTDLLIAKGLTAVDAPNYVRSLPCSFQNPVAQELLKEDLTSLIWITEGWEKLGSPSPDHFVNNWKERSLAFPGMISLRAGFGWNNLSMRSYGGTFLNQSDAPSFIRISVGPMSAHELRLATELI